MDTKANFKYYEVHDFHKEYGSLNTDNKQISLFHTNICSLKANIENLEILFQQLDHNFDIIALSETWNPENKKHLFTIRTMDLQAPQIKVEQDFIYTRIYSLYLGRILISNIIPNLKNFKEAA